MSKLVAVLLCFPPDRDHGGRALRAHHTCSDAAGDRLEAVVRGAVYVAPAADEIQKSRAAGPRLLERRDDAGALMTGRNRGGLLCRCDEHLVAAGDGLPLRGQEERVA